MAPELLSFREVGYAYPDGARLAGRHPALRPQALEDVTFSVATGSAIALVGANGSGKSTLLHVADGLLVPDRGAVAWRGASLDRSRTGLARLRTEVGLVFQDPDDQLFAETLFQDVAFGPMNLGLPRSEVRERVEEALAATGLLDCAELPPHVLSHGMRKRAALAGALAMRPRLLLLDEPTAGLDPESEEQVLAVLTELVDDGVSVVLSTHDLELARNWAHEALVLDRGRVAAFGGAEELLSDGALLEATRLRRRSGWRGK